CGPALSRPPKATESLLDTGTLPPVFGWNRSRTDIHIPIPRTTPADRLLIFSLSENMRGTIPCSSTPPTPRLPAAQGRSPVSMLHNSVKIPVDLFAPIRYTGFALYLFAQTKIKAKRQAVQPL